MSFLAKAMEVSEKAFDETEHTIEQWNIHRHGAKLLLKLGIAVYAEQRLGGTHAPVERLLGALDGHASEHGEVDLDHLRAAHEVLGEEFIQAHEVGVKADDADKADANA